MFTQFIASLALGACILAPVNGTPVNQSPDPVPPSNIGTMYTAPGRITGIEEECAVLITLDNGQEYSCDAVGVYEGQNVTVRMMDPGTPGNPKDDAVMDFYTE